MFDQPQEAKIRYLAVTELEDRHLVLVEQPDGRVFALSAIFLRRPDADDYADIVNRAIGHIVPPPTGTSLLGLLTQRISDDVLGVVEAFNSRRVPASPAAPEPTVKPVPFWTDADALAAAIMRNAGAPYSEIGRRFGRTSDAVASMIKKRGRNLLAKRLEETRPAPEAVQSPELEPIEDPIDGIRSLLLRQIADRPAPAAAAALEPSQAAGIPYQDKQAIAAASRRLKLKEMWERGDDAADIAKALGYASPQSVITIATSHMRLPQRPKPARKPIAKMTVPLPPPAPVDYPKPLAKEATKITADQLVDWFKGREFRCEKRDPNCFLLGPTRLNREDFLDKANVLRERLGEGPFSLSD